MIFDISRRISPALKVWPDDTPFSSDQLLDMGKGHSVNLFTLHMSAHTGTHADAPYHYDPSGGHPDSQPLEKYIGAAHVVTITRQHGGITPADLGGFDAAKVERLLLRTWVSDLPDDQWPDDFPYPSVELIDWLADRGGVLIGVDMPSVDAFDSKDLPAHHRLYARGMVNLETLYLHNVPDGDYELIVLPLKIADGCASPVRAVLRK